MPRGAQVTTKTHPQRERIETALLSGMKPTQVAKADWLSPKLSHVAICKFWNTEIKPRLNTNASVLKTLAENGLIAETANVERVGQALAKITEAQLAADPFIARVEKLRADREKVKELALTGEKPDLKAWVAADRNDLAELELHARLAGRLEQQPTNQVNVFVACPGTPGAAQDTPAPCLDITAEPVP